MFDRLVLGRSALTAALVAGTMSFSGSAFAQDVRSQSGLYAGASAGFNFTRDAKWKDEGAGYFDPSGKFGFDDGLAVLGAVGYRLGNGFRVEGELGYRGNDVNKACPDGGGCFSQTWDSRTISLMANVLYDFNIHSVVTPYVGLGLGVGSLRYKDGDWGSKWRETDFAWQGIVGAAIKLTDSLDLTADYRYFDMRKVELEPGFKVDNKSHALLVGLRWNFGAPPPAPKPMAAPAAPPAPVAAPAPKPAPAVVPRSFLIFFDWDKSTIRPDARRILEAAAAAAKQGAQVSIQLTGHADRSGATRYNQRLSERRAAAAKAELVKLGLTPNAIATVGKGESQPLVATADGVREPRNRRVEIQF